MSFMGFIFLDSLSDVCNNGTVKPVSFHQNHNSKFFIANAIWDQMEPDW